VERALFKRGCVNQRLTPKRASPLFALLFYLFPPTPCSPPPLPFSCHCLTTSRCLRLQLFPTFADKTSRLAILRGYETFAPNKPIWSIRTALMRSEQIAGWSCSECKHIRTRAHYVALSAATPPPTNIRRAAISRGHTIARITAFVNTCEILRVALSAWREQMPPRSETFRTIAGAHSL
jgi:hypothetical protein